MLTGIYDIPVVIPSLSQSGSARNWAGTGCFGNRGVAVMKTAVRIAWYGQRSRLLMLSIDNQELWNHWRHWI